MRSRRLLRIALCLPALVLLAGLEATPATAHGTDGPPAHTFIAAAAAQRAVGTQAERAPANLVVRDPDASSGNLWLYPGTGATSANPWTQARQLTGGGWNFADLLVIGDVTGDGHPDIVARDPKAVDGTLWVYPYTADKPWTTRFSAGTDWNFTNAILLADVTGDGHEDLIARDPLLDSGTMWVYPGTGSTTSNPWSVDRIWSGTGWNLANVLLAGDVTGDGHPDIVARDDSGALWIYPHNGSATVNPWTSRFGAGTGWNLATAMLLGDVTGDDRPDVIIRDATGRAWVYPHNGSSTANPWTAARYQAGNGWNFADRLLLADVDGDGHPDLLARPGGNLLTYPNNGAATGNPWPTRKSAGAGWGFANQLLLSDLGGDGHSDLIARDPMLDNGTLWVYPSTDKTWDTRFAAGTGWNSVTALATGDVTGDGHPDLLARDVDGALWIYPGTGSSTANPWTLPRTWAGTGWNTASELTLADVNRDGTADLIDLENDGSLWIYPTGSDSNPIRVARDFATTDAIAAGDVRGTGSIDLLTRDDTGRVWIHPNNGSTTGDPWTTQRLLGRQWHYAKELLLGP